MNSRILYISLIMFFLLSIDSVYSEEVLTWEECVRKAKENNPDLASAAERVRQAKKDRDIKISAMLPQVDAEAAGKKSKTAGKKEVNAYSYSVTGQQLVFDGFKTSTDVTSALKTVKAEEYNYSVVSSDIRLNLRRGFTGLMRAEGLVSITENIAERRKKNFKLVKLRYESGREHKGALLTAEADMAKAEFEVTQAKRGVILSQRELSKELGIDKLKSMKAKGEFSLKESYGDKPDLEKLVDRIPFLKELITRKEAARYDLNSSEADFLPQVYLNASAGKTYTSWPPRNEEWSAGVSVSLPLFEGGSRIAEVSKARSKLRQAQADERSGRLSVLVTLEKTWKDLLDAIMNVLVQKKFLEAAEERARITKAQYETGLASFNDWIIIEDNLVNAKKSYLNAEADMLLAEAYWVQAIGGTLDYGE